MDNFSFVQILVLILAATIGVIAVRVTFSLDLNKYFEDKRKRYIPKLQNACTHLEFIFDDKMSRVGYQSLFVSPSGTLQWQCQRCGLIRLHQNTDEVERQAHYYINNPDKFQKQTKKFHKLLKKAGQI